MTGVPGFSGNDGIPVSPSISPGECNGSSLYAVLSSDCCDFDVCRATQDKLGPGGSQVQTAATGHREKQASQGNPALMAHLDFL